MDPDLPVEQKTARVRAELNGAAQRPPEWLDAVDLVAEPEPDREWVVEGLLERQGRLLLAGAEGAGKSLLALHVAVQAAAGLPVLGQFGVEYPRTVVYFDLEMARSSTRRRLRQLRITCAQEGQELQERSLYCVMRPDGLDLSSMRERRGIEERIERIRPELIVVDPLYKLSLTDSLYERDIKPTLAFLDQLRLHYGTALVLIHHLRKRSQGEVSRGKDSSDVFGSSVLLRWPEAIMTLTAESLRVHKDRDDSFAGVKSFPIERGGRWMIGLADPVLNLDEEVLYHLSEHGPLTSNQVVRDLQRRRADVFDSLKRLHQAGRIARDSASRWTA